MTIDRRRLLAGFGLGATALATTAQAHGDHAMGTFEHGVASGDPLQTQLICWTRLTPHDGHGLEDIEGELHLWVDRPEGKPAKVVKVAATADRDWTVKADVNGLKPGTEYAYRFKFGTAVSPVGRGKTLPEKADEVVLAVASCALYVYGHFNAYGAIAQMDRVDAVLHLGDYIYEYGADQYGAGSPASAARKLDPPTEIVTLADYRRRHACYKTDPNLQAAHARASWIVVWDDHETANDSWSGGAENHTPATEGAWADRKAAALKAYFEWMPIRDPKGPMSDAIYRSFRFGDLATLLMTETRLTARTEALDAGRDLMVDGKPDIAGFMAKLNDPARRLMDDRQHAWLRQELDRSVKAGETWQVIGNQIVMGKVLSPDLKKAMGEEAWNRMLGQVPKFVAEAVTASSMLADTPIPVNLDQWDGYPADRERVYASFKAARARPIVLAGDSHSFWANELSDASGTLVAAEFGATGVTSPGFADMLPGAPLNEALVARNPEVKFADSGVKGFVKLTLTKSKAVADFVTVSTIFSPEYEVKTLKSFTVTPDGTGVSRIA
jgi:alkaline phosphatase D